MANIRRTSLVQFMDILDDSIAHSLADDSSNDDNSETDSILVLNKHALQSQHSNDDLPRIAPFPSSMSNRSNRTGSKGNNSITEPPMPLNRKSASRKSCTYDGILRKSPLQLSKDGNSTCGQRSFPSKHSSDRAGSDVLRSQRSSTTSYDCSEARQNHDKKRSSIKSFLSSCTTERRSIDEQVLHQKESRGIWCVRLLTFTTLVAAATIVASLTYTLTHNYELSEFKTEYESSVVKVEEAIGTSIKNKINTARTLAAMYTSRYGPQNTWPNVTMPNFQHIAVGQLSINDAIALSYNPIVNGTKQQKEFEAYATNVADNLGAEQLVERSCDTCRVVADGIFRRINGVVVNETGISAESRYPEIMVPVWQIFPTKVNWRAVMFNLHSETNRQRALDDMLEHHVPTITALLHLVQHDEMNPSSILFYPVFDHFVQEIESEDTSSYSSSPYYHHQDIKGSISIVFTWADILHRVLPSHIEGMIVVLESSVSFELPQQIWTYEVNGQDVSLLGEGDKHDEDYDDFEHVVTANVAHGAESLDIVDYLITYRLRMYPSKRFEQRYTSKRPGAMTGVVVCIFALTSLIFLFYDCLLKNRLNAMVAFASRSGKIVNSLFPENVRSRMMDNAHYFAGGHEHGSDFRENSPRRLAPPHSGNETPLRSSTRRRNFAIGSKKSIQEKVSTFFDEETNNHRGIERLVRQSSSSFNGTKSDGIVDLMTPPIADLFPQTSIMFADIVGFTGWSSTHSPEEVFRLLETLFIEFDRLAMSMNVFKLGTIGDCYIAVTGIPDERKDHAKVLCQFAEGCRIKMNKVVEELHDPLGHVNSLSMRFGIHSGPVTAGVLRGHKSRFELFGDTINTASRMESNGLPNKIQVSQETANLLINAGHMDWIIPRTALVQAKGKGMLQTYWFDPNSDKTDQRSPLEMVGENTYENHHPLHQTNVDVEMGGLSLGGSSSNSSGSSINQCYFNGQLEGV